MSDTSEPQAEMSSEVTAVRDALASQAGDGDFAESFKSQTFANEQEVYLAFANRGEAPPPEPSGDPAPPDGDELILGKFKSPEDLANAYKALEAKLGQPKPQEDTPPNTEDTPTNELEIKAKDAVEAQGLSMDALQAHFNEHGSLSEDHYGSLAKGGLDKATVDAFINEIGEARTIKAQAQQVALESLTADIQGSVGGAEAYGAMVNWAGNNLDQGAIDAFNQATNSGDGNLIRLAVDGLEAKYKAAVGSGSTKGFVSGAAKAPTGVRGFESQAEMVQAMNDKRFESLPSYREEVRQRMAKTTSF
jgi:hypothetical protein